MRHSAEPLISRGERKGQLRYYLRAARWERRNYGLRRACNRFWAGRWFWSAGKLGPVPVGYDRSYWWRRPDQERSSRRAATYLIAAIDFPIGAAVHAIWGWWMVLWYSLAFVALAIAVIVIHVRRAVREQIHGL